MARDQNGNHVPDDLVELLDADEFDPELDEDEIEALLGIDWWVPTYDGIPMGVFVREADLDELEVDEAGRTPLEAGVGPTAYWRYWPPDKHCWNAEEGWHGHE